MSSQQPDPSQIGQTERIDIDHTATSQIHHGAMHSSGNVSEIAREKVYVGDPEEPFQRIPWVKGNAVRGHIRRLLAEDLIERVGYTIRDERLYHLLRAGGVLEQDGKAEIDVGLRREIREALPTIDLLGASTGNQMFQGTVNIGHMILVCEENEPRTGVEANVSHYELVDTVKQAGHYDHPDDTGMDTDFGFDFDDEDASANDHADERSYYGFKALIPNTRFVQQIAFESYATELARSCMFHGLALWQDEGVIGGKSSQGYGQVDMEIDADLSDRQLYLDYVEENSDTIIEALDTLSAK